MHERWARALAAYRTAARSYLEATRIERPVPPTADTGVPAPTERESPAAVNLDVLTRREREVAVLLARGLSNRQIAEALVIERGTVANHVAHILAKLGVTNRTQVATLLASGGDELSRGSPGPP